MHSDFHTRSLKQNSDRVRFALICAILIGLITSAWLHPGLWILTLLGHVGLTAYAMRQTPPRAAATGVIIGTVSLAIAFHWAPTSISRIAKIDYAYALMVFAILVLWESLIFGFYCGFISVATRRAPRLIWFAPLAWVAIEYQWPRIFSWALAHAFTSFSPILQVAELAGASGISAVIGFGILALAMMATRKPSWRSWAGPMVTLSCIGLLCGWGILRQGQIDHLDATLPRLRVAAIQVAPSPNESIDRMRSLSLRSNEGIDLVLWPESSLGRHDESVDSISVPMGSTGSFGSLIQTIDPTQGFTADLIAGGDTYRGRWAEQGPFRITAFLIAPDSTIRGRYVKRSLLPIGEYLPGESWLPRLRYWIGIKSRYVAGQSDAPLELSDGQRVGTLICYDDTVAMNSRKTVLAGAECIVAIINGAAFEDSRALSQHLRLATLRAVENRRGFVRCASTGFTCYISASGRIEQSLPLHTEGRMIASVPLSKRLTFYTRFGDVFAWACGGITVLALLALCRPNASRDRPHAISAMHPATDDPIG